MPKKNYFNDLGSGISHPYVETTWAKSFGDTIGLAQIGPSILERQVND